MPMKCPSCHFEQPENRVDCECCGLVFEKWKKRQNPPSAPLEIPPPEKEIPEVKVLKTAPKRKEYIYQQLASADFQELDNGGWVYYPWGGFGRGFTGSEPEVRKKIERFTALFSCVHCPCLAILWTLNLQAWLYFLDYRSLFFIYFIVYLVAAYGLFWALSRKWTAALTPSKIKFNKDQYWRSFKMVFYWRYSLSLEMLSLFLLVASIWLWLSGNFLIFFEENALFMQRLFIFLSLATLVGSSIWFYFPMKKYTK